MNETAEWLNALTAALWCTFQPNIVELIHDAVDPLLEDIHSPGLVRDGAQY